MNVPDQIQRAFTAERTFYLRDRLDEYIDKVCEVTDEKGDAQFLAFSGQ